MLYYPLKTEKGNYTVLQFLENLSLSQLKFRLHGAHIHSLKLFLR